MLSERDRTKLRDLEGQRALRARINLMCRDCIYDPKAGGSALAQIEACNAADCPLHAVRARRRRHTLRK